MMRYLALLCLIAGFLVMDDSYGKEEVYYCAEVDDNGFNYNAESGRYEPTRFFTDKFKMKLDTDSNRIDLAFDDSKESYTCTILYPYAQPEVMSCNEVPSGGYGFNFNTINGRFVYSTGYGYVSGDGDSISISYGKCDKF